MGGGITERKGEDMKNSGKVIEGNFNPISEGGAKVEDKVQVQMTQEQLKAQLKQMEDAENAQRVNACAQGIGEVLQKHNCMLEVQMVLRSGNVSGQVLIVPKPAK